MQGIKGADQPSKQSNDQPGVHCNMCLRCISAAMGITQTLAEKCLHIIHPCNLYSKVAPSNSAYSTVPNSVECASQKLQCRDGETQHVRHMKQRHQNNR